MNPHVFPVGIVTRPSVLALSSFLSFFLSFFQIKHCDDLGIPADKSSTLFLFIGVFAAVGRLSAGCLCNMKRVNSLFLYQAAVFVMGASTMLFLQAKTYAPLAAVVVVFSLADGLMVSTCIIVLFRSVQVSQRAPSLGFSMMAGGIFIVCSPPLSGESVYFLDVTLRERMGVPRRRYFVTVYRLGVNWSVRKSNRNPRFSLLNNKEAAREREPGIEVGEKAVLRYAKRHRNEFTVKAWERVVQN